MKTACVYHSIDLDGWMSAAIVQHWFNKTYDKTTVYNNSDKTKVVSFWTNDEPKYDEILVFIGYNYGDPIPDLSEYDRVIMVDVSLPNKTMYDLAIKLGVNFVWIDHHQPKINEVSEYLVTNHAPTIDGLTTIEGRYVEAACELTWQYFFPGVEMPEIVRLLGRYDCFGHKDTEEELEVLEFQYGARSIISDYQQASHYLKESLRYRDEVWKNPTEYSPETNIQLRGIYIYQYLLAEAKQAYKNGFEIIFDENTQSNKIGAMFTLKDDSKEVHIQKIKFICINKERFNPINFGIDYHADGYDGAACFHYDGVAKLWRFSLYNDNGTIDCSAIAKEFGGGGHKGASGFVVKDLSLIFKTN